MKKAFLWIPSIAFSTLSIDLLDSGENIQNFVGVLGIGFTLFVCPLFRSALHRKTKASTGVEYLVTIVGAIILFGAAAYESSSYTDGITTNKLVLSRTMESQERGDSVGLQPVLEGFRNGE